MTMVYAPRIIRHIREIEANTTEQKMSATEQLSEVAKIVGQAEIMANRLREAADTFTNRERPEGLK